jgi:hypothetical protein
LRQNISLAQDELPKNLSIKETVKYAVAKGLEMNSLDHIEDSILQFKNRNTIVINYFYRFQSLSEPCQNEKGCLQLAF